MSPGPDRERLTIRAAAAILLGCLSLTIVNGIPFGGFYFLAPQIRESLGASAGALQVRDMALFGAAAASAPVAGWLLDRFGVRPLLVIGNIGVSIALVLTARVTSLPALYMTQALVGIALAGAGTTQWVVVVFRATRRYRGIGVGLIVAGSSLGSAVVSQVEAALLRVTDWRGALETLALLPLLPLPGILAIVRGRLSSGVEPDADAGSTAAGTGQLDSLADALRTARFWYLAVAAGLSFFGITTVFANLSIFLETERGLSPQNAADYQTLFFSTTLLAQIGLGAVGRPRLMQMVALAAMAAGSAMLAAGNPALLPAAIPLFGLGWGGAYAMLQILGVALFAGPAVGRIMMTTVMMETIGGAVGPFAGGSIFDHWHSYGPAFAMVALTSIISLIATARLPAPGRAR